MTNLGKRTMNTASNDPAAPSAQSSAPGWTGI
jgi:hypothetical protein